MREPVTQITDAVEENSTISATEIPASGRELTLPEVTPTATPPPSPPPSEIPTSTVEVHDCSVCAPDDYAWDNPGVVTQFPQTSHSDGFDFSEWLGDQAGDILHWLFEGYDIVNFLVIYVAVFGLVFLVKYINRSEALTKAENDLKVLARIKDIDPDLVEEARIEVAFPHLKGRVSVEDFDDELDETMHADQV